MSVHASAVVLSTYFPSIERKTATSEVCLSPTELGGTVPHGRTHPIRLIFARLSSSLLAATIPTLVLSFSLPFSHFTVRRGRARRRRRLDFFPPLASLPPPRPPTSTHGRKVASSKRERKKDILLCHCELSPLSF